MIVRTLVCLSLTPLFFSPLTAQTPSTAAAANANIRVANLEQDVRALQRELNALKLDMEQVLRDNASLREAAQQRGAAGDATYATVAQLNEAVTRLQNQMREASQRQKNEIIDEISRQIDRLAATTQKAVSSAKAAAPSQSFSDNYPKNGAPYTVQKGDSLGGIARKMNSKVEWIRNANKLPSDNIVPGQELFVPQK